MNSQDRFSLAPGDVALRVAYLKETLGGVILLLMDNSTEEKVEACLGVLRLAKQYAASLIEMIELPKGPAIRRSDTP